MPIYVLQLGAANQWGRPTAVNLVGPFTTGASRDNKIAEKNARYWMTHPHHDEAGILRSTIVELDEPPVVTVKAPWPVW